VSVKERGYYISTLRYGPKKSSVIEKCPQTRGVRSERFHCMLICLYGDTSLRKMVGLG
jgi:hypothetical protein